MSGPRFLSVELSFGRHDRRFELDPAAPTVIVGPNGSGKSTLVEGLLRTVFGFNRRLGGERSLADARRPWDGRPFRSSVRLSDGPRVLSWTRDYETDEVRVEDGREVRFSGTANAAARSGGDVPYWNLVERLFGVGEAEAYARTAFVGQGRILGTEFDAEILRLAAGGHRGWQEACRRIEERHRELTREPVSDAHRRLGRDRRLEAARARLEQTRDALREAVAACEVRDAAGDRLERIEQEIREGEREMSDLGDWRSYLLERDKIEAERADARQRFDHLVDLRADLEDARREASDAERTAEQAGAGDDPPDFRERVDALTAAWDERDVRRAEAERAAAVDGSGPPVVAAAARGLLGAGLLTGGFLTWAGGASWGWVAALAGAALALHTYVDSRARMARRTAIGTARTDAAARLEAAERRVEACRREIPGGDGLDRVTLRDRIAAFERRRTAESRLEEARRRQKEVMRRIHRSVDAEDRPGRPLPRLIADAERRLNAVEADARRLVAEAPANLLERGLSARAVEAETESVRRDLARLRAERDRLLLDRDRAQRVAAEAGRLESRARELGREVEDLERSTQALRAARGLLQDGYDEYREQDEGRLVAAVARRLAGLGEPGLGPFETDGGLEGPTVALQGRRLAIDAPQLSHGQRHLVMIAVRLGAADFLAADGPAVPLIVDEPFAHLDDRHATQVWNLLREIAVERQVVVTTQEEALLERLGVEPDILLERSMSKAEPANRLRGETSIADRAGDRIRG